MVWMISANEKTYDAASAFEKFGFIDWSQSANFDIGDTVYIYCSKPVQQVRYKCEVLACDLSFEEKLVDDYEFWVDKQEYEKTKTKKFIRLKLLSQVDTEMLHFTHLQEHGLNGRIQGPRKLDSSLADFIEKHFTKPPIS